MQIAEYILSEISNILGQAFQAEISLLKCMCTQVLLGPGVGAYKLAWTENHFARGVRQSFSPQYNISQNNLFRLDTRNIWGKNFEVMVRFRTLKWYDVRTPLCTVSPHCVLGGLGSLQGDFSLQADPVSSHYSPNSHFQKWWQHEKILSKVDTLKVYPSVLWWITTEWKWEIVMQTQTDKNL